jgi:dephospho-CoA kinase
MRVFGTVGLNGSGKDAVASIISRELGIPKLTIGDVARNIAAANNIEPTRENLTRISLDYRRKCGPDYFPKEVIRTIEVNNWDFVSVAGVRSYVDVDTFRKRFGNDFILIFVDVSNPAVRFERIAKRGEPRDPKTFNEFLKQDAEEEKNFKLNAAIKEADYVIKNDGDIDLLINETRKLITRITKSSPQR